MADDAAEPSWKGRRLGQRGQRLPGGDEGLLNHVLRLLEITHQRQRRAERELLETPRQFDERLGVAAARQPHQLLVFHDHALSPSRCQDWLSTFRGTGYFFSRDRPLPSHRSPVSQIKDMKKAPGLATGALAFPFVAGASLLSAAVPSPQPAPVKRPKATGAV